MKNRFNIKINLKSTLRPSVLVLSIFTTGMLSSCADQHKTEMKQAFDKSVTMNAQARSHVEWESSPDNSVKIFTHLRDSYKNIDSDANKIKYQRAVCNGLGELSISNLMVFQDELNNPENTETIGAVCQEKLLARINDQTEDEISKFEYKTDPKDLTLINPIDFKLESKVVTLDNVLTTKEMIQELQDGEIVLTFDDGPDGVATDSILNTLKAAGDVKAMFFTKGANIVAFPQKIGSQFKAGHVVANHSWNHFCLKDTAACFNSNNPKDKRNINPALRDLRVGPGELSDANVLQEISSNFEIIKKYVGEMAPFFRFPYGESRDSTSLYLKEHGIFEVGWNIDTNDWKKVQSLGMTVTASADNTVTLATKQEIPFTGQDVMDSALRQLKKQKKGIILFHDIHVRTAEILPQFLFELKKLNFKVVIFKSKNNFQKFEELNEEQTEEIDGHKIKFLGK